MRTQTNDHYLLSNFGKLELEQSGVATEALSISYHVLVLAMKGFTYLSIPIWTIVVFLLS